eukprot:CAMPEP_0202685892 /NCGR_PEP_ID=MMETSP1385-20130828/1719_1 /ASSEMBLY_ACC=CAM_ASM_000861 /TAXON_ID=933848 /ORGANISM="Elphidium margaritaceum" /LENGTH=633 /DNA_ID=CAMNT_0049340363 /DNA_START=384 /DNA_END=2285 /DNA_ORIENTATION=-
MDLTTVQEKLNSGRYSTPYDFAKDMRLIYQNACTFNKPGTLYHSAALKFARKFEEEFEKKIVDVHEHNEFTRQIAKVTLALIKNSDAAPFRMPVNPRALSIPDYLDVIREPIDLGTILGRVHCYTRFEAFCADLYRVWDNCCRYNPKANAIHQLALRLRDLTTKHLRRLCPTQYARWEESASGDAHAAASPRDMSPYDPSSLFLIGGGGDGDDDVLPKKEAEEEDEEEEEERDQRSLVALDVSDAQFAGGDGGDDDGDEEEEEEEAEAQAQAEENVFAVCDALLDSEQEEKANEVMISHLLRQHELDIGHVHELDFTQKEELQRGIQCLDSDHFDPLINMLQSFIPDGEGDDDEVELDVDAIDAPLQVKMYNYMLQAVQQQEAEKVRATMNITSTATTTAEAAATTNVEVDDHDHDHADADEDEDGDVDMNMPVDTQPEPEPQPQQAAAEEQAEEREEEEEVIMDVVNDVDMATAEEEEEEQEVAVVMPVVESQMDTAMPPLQEQPQQHVQETSETPQHNEVQNDDTETPPQPQAEAEAEEEQPSEEQQDTQLPTSAVCETQQSMHIDETERDTATATATETEVVPVEGDAEQATQACNESAPHDEPTTTTANESEEDEDDEVDTPLAADIVF